ncbi:hypothetical protein MSAN_01852500 [Mycena sanguinolenta]|uniref:F-box domain-containing protein n=1 Tax=Mycena sanguinolenta TaxID=230812 RepID=A0A8H6XRN6_9AGAR|nr:hypothetical protein MSAN_01852500 [Mycena sanguinolenta]
MVVDLQDNALAALPTELLIEIFSLCTTSINPLANLNLLRVSKLWRAVVQSSPSIWQHLYLDDHSPITSSRAQAMLWVRQSRPLSFDIHLDVSQSSGLVLPLLSPLLPRMRRWRYFSMTGMRQETFDLSGYLGHRIDPLIISIQDPDDLYRSDLEQRRTFDVTPGWESMNIWVSELPKALSLAPLRFSTIVMTEYASSILTQPRAILDFLSACPSLELFFFTGSQHNDEPLLTPLPVAHLPRLRNLRLRRTCGTRSLLSYIDAPALVELHLGHLNVDFPIVGGGGARGPGNPWEDGDSDDEANDFSRSKYSDHATGMGLRRLLLRSNPPLEVLVMDWSDMRTKDFKFVFSRLERLETFFIEASDMSDKVIELLRPYYAQDEQRVKVRLPRLKSLELSTCNELSGEALLSVLTERVKVTDKWEGQGETLDEVIIAGCEKFTSRYATLLRKELGDRLRLEHE